MRGVALVLGCAAIVLLFAPDNFLTWLGAAPAPVTMVLVQLYGAALAGLAAGAWIARDALLGGIFGRAVAVSGFAHGLAGALVSARAVAGAPGNHVLWLVLAVYLALAGGFGALLFGPTP